MRGERTAWRRRGVWSLLTVGWLMLATALVAEKDAPSPPSESLNTPAASPADSEQIIEPQRGIRPPWREPLIPEKRKEQPKRQRSAHA